jgi:hypothetical protein
VRVAVGIADGAGGVQGSLPVPGVTPGVTADFSDDETGDGRLAISTGIVAALVE